MNMVRPKGSPQRREKKSQQAQLDSTNKPGTEKDLKRPMASKDSRHQHSAPTHDTKPAQGREISSLQHILDNDKNLANYKLTAQLANNRLEITGIVDSLSEKDHLRHLLSKNGVKEFVDSVSISTDGKVLDSHVILEIREELDADHRLEGASIRVHVSHGTVFLDGRVRDRQQLQVATEAANKSRGVTRVVSNLEYVEPELSLESLFHGQVNSDHEGNGHPPI